MYNAPVSLQQGGGGRQARVQQRGRGRAQLPRHQAGWVTRVPSETRVECATCPGKWEDIREFLCGSNVIQRDSVMFATKLHPCLAEVAATNEREVSSRYWSPLEHGTYMELLNLTIRCPGLFQ